jgi:hypothetical protein
VERLIIGAPGRAGRRSYARAVRQPLESRTLQRGLKVGSQRTTALYVVLMAAFIVAIDFLFLKNRFWERLTVNIGIVLVFAAFYFRFLKRP